jgi:ATP-dependent DNA ligase
MRRRLAADTKFIEPCLPSPADKPPSGSNWIHEIKHDGYRLMARRDPVGIRLITRRKKRLDDHFPLVVEAVNHLKVRSCLIDGEVVCCDAQGVTAFHLLRSGEGGVEAQRARADARGLSGEALKWGTPSRGSETRPANQSGGTPLRQWACRPAPLSKRH